MHHGRDRFTWNPQSVFFIPPFQRIFDALPDRVHHLARLIERKPQLLQLQCQGVTAYSRTPYAAAVASPPAEVGFSTVMRAAIARGPVPRPSALRELG
jgi:hypothetical protein